MQLQGSMASTRYFDLEWLDFFLDLSVYCSLQANILEMGYTEGCALDLDSCAITEQPKRE